MAKNAVTLYIFVMNYMHSFKVAVKKKYISVCVKRSRPSSAHSAAFPCLSRTDLDRTLKIFVFFLPFIGRLFCRPAASSWVQVSKAVFIFCGGCCLVPALSVHFTLSPPAL